MTLPENGVDNPKSSASELKARTEICEACNSERHLLGTDVDLNTLEAGNPDVRLKYLVAFTEKLGIFGSETAPKTLHDYEVKRRATEPSFDVTKLPEKRVSIIIRRQQELISETEINSETETSELIYKDRIKQLKSSGKSNVEIINALVGDQSVPESERVKLQSFQAIMDIAQAVPEDAQVIGTRLNTIDFSSGIPEDGEMQTRTVPLAPGKDVKIRDNQFLSVDNAGNKQLKINSTVGNYKVALPDNPTDEDMTQIVSSTQMIAVLHNLNLAEIMYGRPMTDRAGGTIELRFPADINRTKPHLMQFHSSKGDAMIGDVEPEMIREDFEKQGVIKNGSIDWLRFEEMVMANRVNMYIAPENFTKQSQSL